MKKIAFIFVMLFSLMAVNSVKASAAGCDAKCQWSTCVVANCTGPVACGCYFGIAICKCDNDKQTSKMNDAEHFYRNNNMHI